MERVGGRGSFPQIRLAQAPPCMLISPIHLVKPFGDSLQSDWAPGTTAVVPGASGWDRVPRWERSPRVSVVHPLLGSCPEQMMGSKSRMQGKDRSEQETKTQSTVGIDVCKLWLDSPPRKPSVFPTRRQVPK